MPIFDKHCLDIRPFGDSNKIPSVVLDSISHDDTTELIARIMVQLELLYKLFQIEMAQLCTKIFLNQLKKD